MGKNRKTARTMSMTEATSLQSSRPSSGFQFDMECLKKENRSLQAFIEKEIAKPSTPVQNILVLGIPGSGKSSLINTVFRVLTGLDIPVTDAGFGGGQQRRTLSVKWFKHCGIREDDFDDSQDHEKIRELRYKLPNLVDCAGSQNINTEEAKEILELLLGGFLTPGTSIPELERLQNTLYVGCLRNTFTTSNPDWKISKVVFVHSAREDCPEELIKCVHDVAMMADKYSLRKRFPVEIFTVLTRFDEVAEVNAFLGGSTDRGQLLKSEDFLQAEKDLSKGLYCEGNMDQNRIRWINFSDNIRLDHPLIRNITLRFLKRMILRRRDYEPDVEDQLSPLDEIRMFVNKYILWFKDLLLPLWIDHSERILCNALTIVAITAFSVYLLIFKTI